jgi:hypothetical protein
MNEANPTGSINEAKQSLSNNGRLNLTIKSMKTIIEKKKTAKYKVLINSIMNHIFSTLYKVTRKLSINLR